MFRKKKVAREKVIKKQHETRTKELYQWHIKGIALFEQGKFKESLSIFLYLLSQDEIKKSPALSVEMLKSLGGVYFKLQDYNKSLDYYLGALKRTKENPSSFKAVRENIKKELAFTLMLKLATTGQVETALRLCEFRLKKNPKDMAVIEVMGNLLNGLGLWEESNFCYQEVLELWSDDGPKDKLFYKMGLNYFRLNEFEIAEEHFQKGLKENPNNHLNYLGMSQMTWEKKDWPKVIDYLEKAEKLAPEDVSFIPELIEVYCRCDLTKKAISKIQKISKSRNPAVMAQLLNLLMRIKDMGFKEYFFRKTIQICWKNAVFRKELQNALERSSDWRLMDILKNTREKMKGQSKNSSVLVNLLKEGENLIIKKHRLIEKYLTLIGWLIPEEEIKELLNQCLVEEIEKILESAFIKGFKNKHKITQDGWQVFVDKIKEEKGEIFSSLREISCFLEELKNITQAKVVFDYLQKGGMFIEENINKLTFRIFPDFPGELKREDLTLLLDFYKKRTELWKGLIDLLAEGKVIPPAWASVKQWAEKTANRLPVNPILIEEIHREGNNLKMDLIFQRLKPEIYRRAYPIVGSLLKNKSLVLAARFDRKGGDGTSLAVSYFKYIRREMRVK